MKITKRTHFGAMQGGQGSSGILPESVTRWDRGRLARIRTPSLSAQKPKITKRTHFEYNLDYLVFAFRCGP
ncbi:MAG: hypothetical protein ACYSTR_08420 [Planctomycetota bacterium]